MVVANKLLQCSVDAGKVADCRGYTKVGSVLGTCDKG